MRRSIKFFIDNCVPDSVGRILEELGHDVIFLRNVIATDSPDQIVAAVSEMHDAVLVSFDRDFQDIAPRMPVGARRRFKNLSRIHLQCFEPEAASRIRTAISFIEVEYEIAQGRSDKRMHITIGKSYLRTHR